MSETAPQPERRLPNEAQEATLQRLCVGYGVEYDPQHYWVYPPDSWICPGYAEGWIGGVQTTIYVGVDPEGGANS